MNGNVQVQNNGANAAFDIGAAPDCAAPLTIGGNLQVEHNAGWVAIGPAANGQGDTARGNIQVGGNTGGGTLADDSAGGNCQLGDDTPGIIGTGDSAEGFNGCNTTA